MLLARTILIVLLASAKDLVWVLEQPLSTVAGYTHRFQRMLKILSPRGVWTITIRLTEYFGETPKPLRCAHTTM